MKAKSSARNDALNTICPYFTMFPLAFPERKLKREVAKGRTPVVMDVFCGRGTTLYAARAAGFTCYGIDASPVAVAIAKAKLARTTLKSVLDLADSLLTDRNAQVPEGEFWRWAYHRETLQDLVCLRDGLRRTRESGASVVLAAVALGGLHGPLSKRSENAAYFSNQMPRTYASKPGYSVRYWKAHGLRPPKADVREIIKHRVERLSLSELPSRPFGSKVLLGDSRNPKFYRSLEAPSLVVTSPPYFGMKTYLPDQWLRSWFLGGPAEVDYDASKQIASGTATDFASGLATVWDNVGDIASEDLTISVRFGGLRSRRGDPATILRDSFDGSRHTWRMTNRRPVEQIRSGRRQAVQMRVSAVAVDEFDTTWAMT